MSTWEKEYAIVTLIRTDNGKFDELTHVVTYQPVDQAYPTGIISSTKLAVGYRYMPDEDLDTEKAYDIYVDAVKKKRIFGPDMMMVVGA